MEKTLESETIRATRWATLARDWDLARELDSCKLARDSCERQIGLLAIDTDLKDYNALRSLHTSNQQRIDVIEKEIGKRKGRL